MNQWQQPGRDPNSHSQQPGPGPWQHSQQPGAPYGQPQYAPQGYYPPQPPAVQPAKPKGSRARGCAMLGCGGLVAVVILVAALASHGARGTSPAALPALQTVAAAPVQAQPAKPAAAQTLTYKVTGSPADVTYGPTGTDVAGSVPMSVTGPLGAPLYYSISAQLQGAGTVTCEILIDGKVISQSVASGGYNIASCEISRDPLSGQWQNTNG